MLWTLGFIALVGAGVVYYRSDYKKYKQRHELYDREIALQDKIEDEMRQCHGEIDALEKLAGIYEKAEGAHEFHSSEYQLRDIYFSVPDVDVRKQLIAKHRESSRLWIKYLTQGVAVAKASGNGDDLKGAESLFADNLDKPMLFSLGEERTGQAIIR